MKQLLLIAYFYPPLGGPGVQRPLKLVKHLKRYGWETDVITVSDIVFHSQDDQLLREDLARRIYRIPSRDLMSILSKTGKKRKAMTQRIYFKTPEWIKRLIRSSYLIDDKIGWLPNVVKQAEKLISIYNYDAIMATMGPYTSGVIASRLSKKFNLPLIIDYRDHWTLNPYLSYLTPLHRRCAQKQEARILQKSRLVSVVGKVMKSELIKNFDADLKNKILVMYNGWDEQDFKSYKSEKHDKIVLRYIGNFYGNRSPEKFIQVLEKLDENIRNKLQIEFVGNYYQETLQQIKNSKIDIKLISQTNHQRAVELMQTSDILLLLISSKDGNGVITGKLFEYLRCQKPILALIPPAGEAAEILRQNGHDLICSEEKLDTAADNITQIVHDLETGKKMKFEADARLNRENQSKKFVEFLESRL